MSTLTILYKRILANASKASNLPEIEDETQVCYNEISNSILTLMRFLGTRISSWIACKTFKSYTNASSNSQYSAQTKRSKIYLHRISYI